MLSPQHKFWHGIFPGVLLGSLACWFLLDDIELWRIAVGVSFGSFVGYCLECSWLNRRIANLGRLVSRWISDTKEPPNESPQ